MSYHTDEWQSAACEEQRKRDAAYERDAVEELNCAIQELAETIRRYPFLWDRGDGCGGAVIEKLHEATAWLNPPRPERTQARPDRWKPSVDTYLSLGKRDGFCCRYCGALLGLDGHGPTIDHVVPRSRGGTHKMDNLVLACRSCNSRKSDKTPTEAGMPLLASEGGA